MMLQVAVVEFVMRLQSFDWLIEVLCPRMGCFGDTHPSQSPL